MAAAGAAALGLAIGLIPAAVAGFDGGVSSGVRPAGAVTAQATATPLELRLVSQSGLVEANGTFTARIDLGPLAPVAGDPATAPSGDTTDGSAGDTTGAEPSGQDLEVAITVHSLLDSAAGLEEEPSSPINRLEPRSLDQVATDRDGVMTLEMPIRAGAAFDGLERVRIPDPGVYPVAVEVREGGTVVGSIRLNLIRLPGPVGPPVASTGAEPTRDLALVIGVGQPGGLTVAEATDLLARHPGLAATVALRPGVLGGLEAEPALAGSFAEAIGDRRVVASPEPGLDPSALAAIDHGDIYLTATTTTAARLAAAGLAPAEGVAMVGSPLTTAGAELVASAGATIVFDTSTMAASPVPTGATGSPAWAGTDGPGPLRVLRQIESAVTETSTDSGDSDIAGRSGVAAAHDELARLMLGSPDDPPVLLGGFSQDRSLAPLARASVLETLASLFDHAAEPAPGSSGGSGTAPTSRIRPLRIVSLEEAGGSLPGEPWAPVRAPAQDLLPVRQSLDRALDLLATYDSFHAGGADDPVSYRARLAAALSVSVDPDDRANWIAGMNRELEDGLTDISLPGNQSVTLAARRTPIPLTLDNASSGARKVLLRFRSDKIVVAEHGQVITVQPGTSSIDVQVEARSLGESPLEVTVLTPDARHVLSTTRFRVRSTAVPGLGLAISGAGFAALAVWWYVSIKRGRRSGRGRRRVEATRQDPTPGHGPTGPGDTGLIRRTVAQLGDSVKS